MRILILVDCYYPSRKSSAKLVHDLAVELDRRGNQVVVVTPSEAIADNLELRVEAGVSVLRVSSAQIKGAKKIQRALREARLSATVWCHAGKFLRENPCDLILFYSPTIFWGSLVRRLKQLWNCPSYLILRDIFPDWAADSGILQPGLIYQFFRRVALEQYRSADVIAVQSPANLEYFARSYPQEKFQLEVLFNWADLARPGRPSLTHRTRLGLLHKTVFLYGGNIGVAQDMDNILRLALRLAFRSDIHFLLVGTGSEVSRIQKNIALRHLRNIQILSDLSQEEYLAMVSEFDFGLISLDARLKTHNIPGKLMSYLHWGLPILASANAGNDLFTLLAESGAGFCILNGQDEHLARVALRLADDRGAVPAMRKNARRLLEQNFSVEKAVNQIFGHLSVAQLLAPTDTSSRRRIVTNSQVHSPEFAAKY